MTRVLCAKELWAMQNETDALATLGTLIFASLVSAGGSLVLARVLGLDRLWVGMTQLPAAKRYAPGLKLGYLGIIVGLTSLAVMLGFVPATVLSAAIAASGTVVALMGAFVLIAANQARDAALWVQARQASLQSAHREVSLKQAA